MTNRLRRLIWVGPIALATVLVINAGFIASDEPHVSPALGADTSQPVSKTNSRHELADGTENAGEGRQANSRVFANTSNLNPRTAETALQDSRQLDLTRPSSDGARTVLLDEPCRITWAGLIRTIEYENGGIAGITGFKDGRYQGLDQFWHVNQQLRYRGNWDDNKRVGRWEWFDEHGLLLLAGNHMGGKRAGEWIKYHPSGAVASIGSYVRGKREGMWSYLDNRGREDTRESGRYVNGERVDDY